MTIRHASILIIAAIFAGCYSSGTVTEPKVSPPRGATPPLGETYDYKHELSPDPEAAAPAGDTTDATKPGDLAEGLYSISHGDQWEGPYSRPLMLYTPHILGAGDGYMSPYRGRSYRSRRYPWLSTLFWTGLGAVIGHQSDSAWEGAGLGALFGHTLGRPGGMDPYNGGGIFTPNTLLMGGAGAVIGHRNGWGWEGAAGGALLGRGIDQWRRRRVDRYNYPYERYSYPYYRYGW